MNRLREELARTPHRDLLLSERRTLVRAELLSAGQALAGALAEAGSRRCLLQSADSAELLIALVGCQATGADLILAHANLPADHVEGVRAALGVDTLLSGPSPKHLLPRVVDPGKVEPKAGVFLMTSGTTGLPKVIEHQFDRLVGRISPSAKLQANLQGRWLLTYQPTAFAGLQILLTACFTDGTVIESNERTPAAFAVAAERYQCSHISGTPTFWRAFLMAADPGRLEHVRQITLGGEAIDQSTLDRLARAFPAARITQIYASSEAGSLLAISDGKHGFPAAWLDQEMQGVRLRIREGVLEVHSPRLMIGYHAEGQLPPTTDDGWLITGDLVRLDGDRVVFLGRRDAMINVGGAKVFPQEIEAFLLGLTDVAEARVRAVKSPITGQAVVAEIVVAPGRDANEVRLTTLQACRQHLARHQVPALIQVVAEIATADSGKKSGAIS